MSMPPLPDEGLLSIKLKTGTEPSIHIQSSRPLQVSRLMLGKTCTEVSEIIPLLYNVCATAQSRASLLAMQTATDQPLVSSMENARDFLVLMENAREYLIRIFRDWPTLFDESIQFDLIPDIINLLPNAAKNLFQGALGFTWHSELAINRAELDIELHRLDQLIEQHVFGLPAEKWLSLDSTPALLSWAQQTDTLAARSILQIDRRNWSSIGQSPVSALPRLNSRQLIEKLSDSQSERFIATPSWSDQVRETSTFTRQQHHPLVRLFSETYANGLMTRWIARLVELASIPAQLRALFESLDRPAQPVLHDHPGLAEVETARGRLAHYVRLENQVISDYRILAPTEWNFHPQGLIQHALLDALQRNPPAMEQALRCVINVIDPCVGYRLELD